MRVLNAMLCAGLLGAFAWAQEPQSGAQAEPEATPEQTPEPAPVPVPVPGPIELPPLPELSSPSAQESAQQEMIELFQRVETRLAEIDDLLFDASAGVPLEAQSDAGIGDLLQRSLESSEEVRRAMDRILELAEEQGGSESSSGGGPPSSGDSPLDSQPQGQQGSKEQTPEGPSSEPGEHEQPSEGEQPGGEGKPESPRDSLEAPENNAAQDPQSGELGSASGPQGNERWGDLPTHVRDLFRTEGGGDMPTQYRDWIDAYYRRLNQRP